MATKILNLNLVRDYKTYLYFIDKEGSVCCKPKSGEGATKVLVPNAIVRDNAFLYFIDKDGDVARSARAVKKTKTATAS